MTEASNTIGRERIKEFVSQIVMSEREKEGIATDIKEYYAAAKDAGVNVAALRKVVKLQMMSPTKRQDLKDFEDTVDQYLSALGMFD